MLTLIMSWLTIQLGKQGRVVPMELVGGALVADFFLVLLALYTLHSKL